MIRTFKGQVKVTYTDIFPVTNNNEVVVMMDVQPDGKITHINAFDVTPGDPGSYMADTQYGWLNFSTEPGRYTLYFPSGGSNPDGQSGQVFAAGPWLPSAWIPLRAGSRMEVKPAPFYTSVKFRVDGVTRSPSGYRSEAKLVIEGELAAFEA